VDRTWAALNDALRLCVRTDQGRDAQPSGAILDSQSVKSDGHGGLVGYDAGKKINGRESPTITSPSSAQKTSM
jgi:hypothetical protein